MVQRMRRPVTEWLEAHPESVNAVMDSMVCIAFHSHLTDDQVAGNNRTWVQLARGVYEEQTLDMKIDVQTAEILSNNQETRPVPDSMSGFADFENVFGKEALRCAVSRPS